MPENMTVTREKKHKAMRKILDTINASPTGFKELLNLLTQHYPKFKERTLYNYLNELGGLGLIEQDEKSHLYMPAGVTRQVFKNKAEYELQWKHSRNLLFSSKEGITGELERKFDTMGPNMIVDKIVKGEYPNLEEHLKWGYLNDIWVPLQKLRKLKKEHPHAPYFNIEDGFGPPIFHVPRSPEPPGAVVPAIRELSQEILKEIYFLMKMVENENPIRGYCRFCPSRNLRIKED